MSERPDSHEGPILEVGGLTVSFPGLRDERVRVVDDVSFDVGRSETVALVGESGSGKSVTALSLMGLSDSAALIEAGRVSMGGQKMLTAGEDGRRAVRGRRVAMIFQSPQTSLNPLVKAGEQIARVVRLHRRLDRGSARDAAIELMNSVGIADPRRRYDAYPHQLSGGMAQRVMIGMALAAEPELLIADEPTTALDVTIQAQIFDLLIDLRERHHLAVLLITHDLAVVAEAADRVLVMHRGRIVEAGPTRAIFDEPAHPYTQRLVRSILRADRRVKVGELPEVPADGERGPLRPAGSVPGHLAAATGSAR